MKLIAFIGAVGVGKTYWGRQLCDAIPNCQFIQEDTGENLFLKEFYQDMQKWGFHSRISMLSMVLSNINKANAGSDYVIFDRCVQELIVFATKEYEEHNMTDKEFALYRQLYDAVCKLVPTPDLYVYFRCSAQTSFQRIMRRGRDCEKNVTIDFCEDVINRYDAWFKSSILPTEKAIIVNTDQEISLNRLRNDLLAGVS